MDDRRTGRTTRQLVTAAMHARIGGGNTVYLVPTNAMVGYCTDILSGLDCATRTTHGRVNFGRHFVEVRPVHSPAEMLRGVRDLDVVFDHSVLEVCPWSAMRPWADLERSRTVARNAR